MYPIWASDKTVIRRVRVRSHGLDPLTAQRRTAGLLSAAALHPSGLNPAAVLCIRSLRDPQPGALRLHRDDTRPAMEWERAVAGAIGRLARQAARPIFGPVPATAEAVLFADQAELLACLAHDWLAGEAAARWWWQGLFRIGGGMYAVRRAWLDSACYVPAALQHLAERQQAATFVRALNDEDAGQMLRAVAATFGLRELRAVIDTTTPAIGPAPAAQAHTRLKDEERPGPERTPDDLVRAEPWLPWVPEAHGGDLSLTRQCLLGVGLLLWRAPAIVRTPAFARAVMEWQHASMAEAVRGGTRSVSGRPAGAIALPVTDAPPDPGPGLLSPPDEVALAGSPAPVIDPPQVQEKAGTGPGRSQVEPARAGFAAQVAAARLEAQAAALAPPGVDRPRVEAAPAAASGPMLVEPPASQTSRSAVAEEIVETGLGGLFYLINVGLRLGLYGDFTAPLAPGIALPLWDFVARVGADLIKAQAGVFSGDPVWSLLARLAGHAEGDPITPNFDPPDEWRLPAEWLVAFPEPVTWRWSAAEGRLRVQHPAGFWVIDVPCQENSPARQLRREMEVYAVEGRRRPLRHGMSRDRRAAARAAAGRSTNAPFDRWLGRAMPYIRARLLRALGLARACELPRLFRQRARVVVTAVHLHVYMSLSDLPLGVRLAGLDRDPGWVPAAGRSVTFHFEV